MTILIVGASGATGKKLVEQLLVMGHTVKVVVRPTSDIPVDWKSDDRVTIVKGLVHEMSVGEMAAHVANCQAVASCLGHNLSWKGVYGQPRRLVTEAVRLLCDAIKKNAPETPTKLVLMNTAGNRNRDLNEPISLGERVAVGLLRLLLPPHPDNEKAADYLRTEIGQNNPLIEWVTVRPDDLIDEEKVTAYELHASPTRSAIFDSGKTSRINVGHFMAQLVADDTHWHEWKGQMPVIYNKE